MDNPKSSRPAHDRVLITGAAGYTGLALASHLIGSGMGVRGLVRRASQDSDLARAGAEVVAGDIRERSVVEEALQGVDTVYHLAAVFRKAGVPDSEYRTVHVDATRQLVERSAAAGVRRFVHCSTVGVHGSVGDMPANEDEPFRPGDIYQATKLEGEQVAVATASRLGLPFTVVRPGPIYGPRERRLLKIIGGVARGRFVIVGDGRPRFQMVYIEDLVRGIRLAGESPAAIGRTYILTGDEAPTLNQLVREIADVARVRAPTWRVPIWPLWLAGAACEAVCVPLGIEPPIFRRRVKFFTNSRWFDTSRARAELGYRPSVPLRHGLSLTLDSDRQLGWV
ncbi:MAG TPA: NAD-dependent epimerase/dehydratase family protein [Gemmatimonadales bacterium]|nr:NAD-dependent epimerase/dehydratase family protein [Gemmatimonadales bacterium]